MVSGTGGNQTQRPKEERPALDLFITPIDVWKWFFDLFEPAPGTVIYDPACCGYDGWTAGGYWADMHDRSAVLADLNPMSVQCRFTNRLISTRDFITASARDGRITQITNCPFGISAAWVSKAVQESVEVILLVRAGFLATGNGKWRQGLHSYWQPARRMSFLLHPDEGRRRIALNEDLAGKVARGELSKAAVKSLKQDVVIDPKCLTGYRGSTTGIDHGFAVWRKGYTGIPAFMLETAETNFRRSGQVGLFSRPQQRISTEMSLQWQRAA